MPGSLRRWFVAHFVVDVVFGLPLLLAPAALLSPLGWTCLDPVAPRLVGAALIAIGTQSFLGRDEGADTYRAMLNLKLIWSSSAIVGLLAGIAGGAPPAAWAFLSMFVAFSGVWTYYRIRLLQMSRATDHPFLDDEADGAAGASTAPRGE